MTRNQTIMTHGALWEMDKRFPAYRWLLRHLKIIHNGEELGKPYLLPEWPGNDLARGNDGLEGAVESTL
jgi:hypothetical protein